MNNQNAIKEGETTAPMTKRSYSYQDLINMQSATVYSSMGKVIPSQKPSAPRATFGRSERKVNQKKFESEEMAKIDSTGKLGLGPAAYLPPRYTLTDGQIITGKNPADNLQYNSTPSFSIGREQRKSMGGQIYNYMYARNDYLDTNQADLARRNSQPNCRIGTGPRFHDIRKDKITPGPTYDPINKPEIVIAPKYTIGARRVDKGNDPLNSRGSTTELVGPSSYFQKGKRSNSVGLLRVPSDSKIKNQPQISFTKGPKSLANFKNSVDQTYDIKTKTIMAHYDFDYDAGKGLNSGLSYMKKNIIKSSMQPLEKNKMKSYSITHASRQAQQKRGTFLSMMSQAPQSIKINHPKF